MKNAKLMVVAALVCVARAQIPAVSNVTVTFSATPTFTANAPATNFDITLTGNVTSSTFLPGGGAPTVGSLRVCQDSTGGRTFVAPTGSVGFGAIDATASKCSTTTWKWDGTTLRATGPFVKDDGTVIGGGGSGTPAGSSGDIQVNLSGSFGAAPIANCVATGGVLQYTASTHTFSCHTLAAGDVPDLSATYATKTAGGDLSGTLPSPTVAKVNGTSVPVNSAADQVLGTTASGTGTWISVGNCVASGGVLQYATASHTFSCHTLAAGDIPGLSATYQAVAGKDVNGGYVGRDSSGNSTIPALMTAGGFSSSGPYSAGGPAVTLSTGAAGSRGACSTVPIAWLATDTHALTVCNTSTSVWGSPINPSGSYGEIFNIGTAKWECYTDTGASCSPASGGGTLSASGTPLIHQLSAWVNATTLKGLTAGTDNQVMRGATGADPAFGPLVVADLPGEYICTPATASGTTYACTPTNAPTAYTAGEMYVFIADVANTGAATINLNSLGAKTIKKVQGGITTALAANDIRTGQIVTMRYDGTNMQMLSQLGNAPSGTGDVVGPSSAVDSNFAAFDTTTGKLIKDSTKKASDFALAGASTTVNGQACALGSTCTVADATKVPTTTTVNGHALSGNISVTTTDLSLNNVTNDAQTKAAVMPNTAPTAGQVPCGNAGGTAYAPCTVSGDGTLASTGALTVTKLNSVSVAQAATASTIVERNASGEVIAANTVPTGKTAMATDTAVTDAQMAAKYKLWSCQPGIGDGLNAITAGTYLQSICYNDTGVAVTLSGIKCFTDNGGTSALSVTNGAGTALLTGAVTCSSSFAAGTQSGTTTIASGDYLKFSFVADGTSKQSTWVVSGSK